MEITSTTWLIAVVLLVLLVGGLVARLEIAREHTETVLRTKLEEARAENAVLSDEVHSLHGASDRIYQQALEDHRQMYVEVTRERRIEIDGLFANLELYRATMSDTVKAFAELGHEYIESKKPPPARVGPTHKPVEAMAVIQNANVTKERIRDRLRSEAPHAGKGEIESEVDRIFAMTQGSIYAPNT